MADSHYNQVTEGTYPRSVLKQRDLPGLHVSLRDHQNGRLPNKMSQGRRVPWMRHQVSAPPAVRVLAEHHGER